MKNKKISLSNQHQAIKVAFIISFFSQCHYAFMDTQLPSNFNLKAPLPSFADLNQTIQTPKDNAQSDISSDANLDNNIVVTFKDNPPATKTNGDFISVDFVNEDIKQVLRYVSELYDLNIIIPSTLKGSVTIRLKNTTWESLLESVLGPVGCTYTKYDNIIQICSLESINNEPLKTETFLLKFADAKKVAKELKDFVDNANGGKITFNERSNVLIITDRSKNISVLHSIIDTLDKPEAQVMIEAKFVEASKNVSDSFGFSWPSSLTASINDPESSSSSSTSTNNGSSSDSSSSTDGTITRRLNNSKAFKPQSLVIKTLSSTFNFSQTDNIGKTLSNPTIITMNNVPATMSVVENYPVPNYSYNSDQASYEISGFEEKPIGLELKVTPKVQAEFITLKIEPSLSSQTKTVPFETKSSGGTSSINYPQISQKKTDSMVTIKSGYTIAIGGLMTQTKQDKVNKVPFFGDIPLLGKLFSDKTLKDDVTNLLIFLSATQIAYDGTILYPQNKETKNVSSKKLHDLGLTKNDLPGEDLSEQEQKMYAEIQSLKAQLEDMVEHKKIKQDIAETKESISNFVPYQSVKPRHKYRTKKHSTHQYITKSTKTNNTK